ncbi:MAG: MurR/RpiR family transcriptional regulator [Thermomicrobiales bacterium]
MANSVVVVNGMDHLPSGEPVRLSRKQRTVVSYIEHNPKFAAFATAGELGSRTNVHPSTVVRLAQLLGYAGFPEFQAAIRHTYLCSLDAVSLNPPHPSARFGDVVTSSLDQDMRNLATTRASLDGRVVQQVARLVEAAPASLAIGGGSHGGLALVFSHLCRFMGLPVDAEIRGGISLAARLSQVGPGHVVFGSSAWWVLNDTREALTIAREQGAHTVAIADSRASPLAQVAEHVLITRSESVCFNQSLVGHLAIVNAIVAEIATNGSDEIQERMQRSTATAERLGAVWQHTGTEFEAGSAPAGG